MGYSSHPAELKIECVRRYFSDPPISIRDLASEVGVPFGTVSNWIQRARRAGVLGPGEKLPPMVEVRIPQAGPAPAPAEGGATFTISIGKATLTLPSSMLAQALEALSR